MQAEHAEVIANPDPDADHRIEGVAQVSYRVSDEYDADSDALRRDREEQVDELTDPELQAARRRPDRTVRPRQSRRRPRREDDAETGGHRGGVG